MVYGALVMPRTRYRSKVLSIDDSEARKIPGFIKAVKIDDGMGKCTGWVVAVAEKFPAAVKAAKVAEGPGRSRTVRQAQPQRHLRGIRADARRTPTAGADWVLEGDVDKGLASADKVLDMEYTTDMVCHATMEPLNATVQFVDGAWHVYTGTQSTSFARMTLTAYLSKVLKTEARGHQDLRARVPAGRRLRRQAGLRRHPRGGVLRQGSRPPGQADPDPRVDVRNQLPAHADLPQAQGRPEERRTRGHEPRHLLRLDGPALLRRQEVRHRLAAARFLGREEAGHRSMVDRRQRSLVRREEPSRPRLGQRPHHLGRAGERAAHGLELVQHVRGRVVHGRGGARAQPRSARVPPGHAQRQGQQPRHSQHRLPARHASDYYMDRLWISLPWPNDNSWPPYESATVGGALRLANCLRVAAGKAGWGSKKLPPNTGMGIAVSSAEERQSPTWVAGIAEVTVDPKTGNYTINRLTIAMDPGTVINPLGAKAQIQGAALWGASQVMSERLTLKNGAIEQSNFHEYTPIRLAEVPPIDVELIESGHHPSGVGEPASTVVAPAVANAIYNAVGVRVRHMPITAEAILAGLKKKA